MNLTFRLSKPCARNGFSPKERLLPDVLSRRDSALTKAYRVKISLVHMASIAPTWPDWPNKTKRNIAPVTLLQSISSCAR